MARTPVMKRVLALAGVALALLMAGCGRSLAPIPPKRTPSPIVLATAPPDAWAALQQAPLQIPTLTSGEACPVSPSAQVNPEFGDALGVGPVFLVGFGQQGIAHLSQAGYQNGLFNLLVMLIAPPAYAVDMLVRGRQMDGPNSLRFALQVGSAPLDELQLSSDNAGTSSSGWLTWNAYIEVSGPGCYGLQIDSAGFSEVIVFQVAKA